jgi:hypothetical protein
MATTTLDKTITQKKAESLKDIAKRHEDRIKQIKAFVGQPVDPNKPIPLFQQLKRWVS